MGWRDVVGAAGAGEEILVVDDDPVIRRLLHGLLGRLGYSVDLAASCEEAEVRLSGQRYAAALLDIEMPGTNGVELLGRALEQDPEMVVIMLTSVDRPEVALECIEAGARTYLVKPPTIEFLSRAIRDALGLRRILVERNDLARSLSG